MLYGYILIKSIFNTLLCAYKVLSVNIMANPCDNIEFCSYICRISWLVSTPAGSEALKNKFNEILQILLNTTIVTFTPHADAVLTGTRVSHKLTYELINLCFMAQTPHFIACYPLIRQILVDETARIHQMHLDKYCQMYHKDIDTVTATELARAMTLGIRVSYKTATRKFATHFGVAFLHMQVVRKNSRLSRTIQRDIYASKDIYTAADLFKYLISIGRA